MFGAVFAIGSPAPAQNLYAPQPAASAVQPLDRILPLIRQGRPGRFYDAEGPFPGGDGLYHYRIKWLTPDGRVIWLDTNARTGRVMGIVRGDWRAFGPPPVGGFFERGPRRFQQRWHRGPGRF
jgi:hypothetical protein